MPIVPERIDFTETSRAGSQVLAVSLLADPRDGFLDVSPFDMSIKGVANKRRGDTPHEFCIRPVADGTATRQALDVAGVPQFDLSSGRTAEVKAASVLDAPGVSMLFRGTIADVVLRHDGWWEAEKLEFVGHRHYDLAVIEDAALQPQPECFLNPFTEPDRVGGITGYTKKEFGNNIFFLDGTQNLGMNSKSFEIEPPKIKLFDRDGNLLDSIKGVWEIQHPDNECFLVKLFDPNTFPSGWTRYETAITFGYTTGGASSSGVSVGTTFGMGDQGAIIATALSKLDLVHWFSSPGDQRQHGGHTRAGVGSYTHLTGFHVPLYTCVGGWNGQPPDGVVFFNPLDPFYVCSGGGAIGNSFFWDAGISTDVTAWFATGNYTQTSPTGASEDFTPRRYSTYVTASEISALISSRGRYGRADLPTGSRQLQ